MKGTFGLLFAVIFSANAWSAVRNPFQMLESQPSYQTITECMHVTSEEGGYTYKKSPKQILPQLRKDFDLIESSTPEMTVCGLYVVTDPDKIVEITIRYMNVNCESGGLMAFVDGWELNGQYFPGVEDHELNLDKRIIEFCNDNKHWPLKQFHRVYRSSQNAALLQYRIPIRGQFVATVRFIHNPSPCNIMAGEVSPIYNLINVGKRNNCTLTALYPAVVSIKNVNVGGTEQHLSYDCEQNKQDRIVVGGSNGLDSSNMERSSSVCGHSEKAGPEQGIFCGVTSVRLSSSGNYVNTAVISIRPADESDIAIATLVC
ncbi:corticotropin-releasing factor-binding protein [Bradysia coprophila]|uniref:corticotropin-releasing factor-binding protein n=1 Tax=Bradysia coprophila TaxID=38358 RepID=UPI00187D7D1E|nr:corticotropin-releasing factor-binding protein [Bradysia coprophila]